ncbi:putative toxin-antitoxin system toxin component, PIN family [bacterium]|nr:putative toxin-antitoxin system toxin component, PIN family [bacterium]
MPERRSIRVVLDTDVLISALLYRKRLGIISDLIEVQIITPCFIKTTFLEFQEAIFSSKFRKAFKKISLSPQELIEALTEKSLIFVDPLKIPNVLKDRPDNYLLACARTAGAFFIVTGDKEIQSLKQFQGIPIVSPKEFLKKYEKILKRK